MNNMFAQFWRFCVSIALTKNTVVAALRALLYLMGVRVHSYKPLRNLLSRAALSEVRMHHTFDKAMIISRHSGDTYAKSAGYSYRELTKPAFFLHVL